MKKWPHHIRQAAFILLFCGQPLLLRAQENPGDLSETTSLIFAIFRVLGSLALVVALMLALIYLIKKTGINKDLRENSLIRVLDNKMVAPKKYIAIVEIAGKTVSVGVSDHNINLLTEIEPSVLRDLPTASRSSSSPSLPLQFSRLLAKARGKSSFKVKEDEN